MRSTSDLFCILKKDEADMTDETIQNDPQSLIHRQKLVHILEDTAIVQSESMAEEDRGKVWKLIQEDPYLSECGFLKESCTTIGRIAYLRDVTLNLQSTTPAVIRMGDEQRDSLTVIRTCAQALQTEAHEFSANRLAEKKAKIEEEKAATRERLRADKERKKAEEKIKKQKEKEMAKIREQEARKAGEAENAPCPEETTGGKRRNRNPGLSEMTEADPLVLQNCQKFPASCHIRLFDDLQQFLDHVMEKPSIPCVARFKKGSIKKVLVANAVGDDTKTSVNSWCKYLSGATCWQKSVIVVSISCDYFQ